MWDEEDFIMDDEGEALPPDPDIEGAPGIDDLLNGIDRWDAEREDEWV